MSPGSTVRLLPVLRFRTLSVVRSSRYATSVPSGEKCGWNVVGSLAEHRRSP